MVENKTTVNGGIGFTGLLTLLFIALKLLGVINWSWVWVLSPIWICMAIWVLVFVGIVVASVIIGCRDYAKDKRKKYGDSQA